MAARDRWGLRLFFAGMVLGLGLIAGLAATNTSASYAAALAPDKYGGTNALGLLIEVLPLVAFGLTVAGLGLLTSPAPADAPAPSRSASEPRPLRAPSRSAASSPSAAAPRHSS